MNALRWLRILWIDLRNGLRAARRQRELVHSTQARERELLAARPRVIKVGKIEKLGPYGFALTEGWEFELTDPWMRHGQSLCGFWTDGEWRAFGYTAQELTEIHARRKEWAS